MFNKAELELLNSGLSTYLNEYEGVIANRILKRVKQLQQKLRELIAQA